jgi:hypothetical protein
VGPTSGDLPVAAGSPDVAPEQLERLRQIPPQRIADPVSIADALYLGGHWDEAFLFYERALAAPAGQVATGDSPRRGDAAPGPSGDGKAWLLFQAANCRRRADPAAAAALYQRLAAEHPQSPWTAVARTRLRILEWRQAERPEALGE